MAKTKAPRPEPKPEPEPAEAIERESPGNVRMRLKMFMNAFDAAGRWHDRLEEMKASQPEQDLILFGRDHCRDWIAGVIRSATGTPADQPAAVKYNGRLYVAVPAFDDHEVQNTYEWETGGFVVIPLDAYADVDEAE